MMIEKIHTMPDVLKGFEQKALKNSRKIHTVSWGLIQITDISPQRNRKGSLKPLKILCRSTMGVQSPSTDASHYAASQYIGNMPYLSDW